MNPHEVEPCRVLWIDLDNGAKKTHERFRAVAAAHGINHAVPVSIYSFPALDLADKDSVVALRDAIVTEGARLVVIDTFINATTVQNENDNAQLRGPMFALRTLCEQTGAAIIAIHHPSKNTQAGTSHDDLRGGGAIAGAADLTLRVARETPDAEEVTVTATKTRGAGVAPLSALWSFERNEVGTMTVARFNGKRHETPAQKADAALEESVLHELTPGNTGPASHKELKAVVLACRNDRLVRVLRNLVETHRVRFQTIKGRGKVYELPS